MILEIRTYRLRPGSSEAFLRVMKEESLPLLESFGLNVVSSGVSLVSENGWEEAYLIRSFASLEEREEQESAFYGSDAWRNGPREKVMAIIESYHTVVLDRAIYT